MRHKNHIHRSFILVLILSLGGILTAQEPTKVQDIAEKLRESIVVVTTENREGVESDMGTGFVIDPKGLIATNLHVIGEARPIWIQTRDGTRHEVTEVYASDRSFDLAILRVKWESPLPALKLAKGKLADGQLTVAVGHPFGLKHSVVSGRIAGERKFGAVQMYQIAMIIEPGNSGSPLVDMQGNVHGVVTLKSTGTNSFGFAVKVSQLSELLQEPNPVSMEQWKTIGQIDAERWTAVHGASWRQRGGKIIVELPGDGFGGRSLLLSTKEPPEPPFELAVSVKLDDEKGAAGLVFHSDGEHKHYGFYPSGGRLRLTNFDGPSVFSWDVVREMASPNYKRNDWNEIKVRVEAKKVTTFVNGEQLFTVNGISQPIGRIGLCKFRQTKAQFKNFRVGRDLPSNTISPKRRTELARQIEQLDKRSELSDALLASQLSDLPSRLSILEDKARELERQADEARALSEDLHVASVCVQLKDLVASDAEHFDLLRGALLIAKLDNRDLDVDTYTDLVDFMAKKIQKELKDKSTEQERIDRLDDYMFRKSGFHGSRTQYYLAANSHMDRVIDDREGLPITLSVLYMSLADRLDLNVVGVGLPGHFVVRHEPKEGKPQLIDVFDRGEPLSRNQANAMVFNSTGVPPTDAAFKTASHKSILVRILTNLMALAQNNDDTTAARRYAEALSTVDSANLNFLGTRSILRHQAGRKRAAIEDIEKILEQEPEGPRKDQLKQIRRQLESR